MFNSPQRICSVLLTIAALLSGCRRHESAGPAATSPATAAPPAGPVVLYTSVDEPYVRPLVQRFQQQTGIPVRLLTDAEASKSVGLSAKLLAERDHPAADVWWDNECFLSIRLADEGALAPYDSPAAADIPAQFRDPAHRWAGSVLRVRVIVSSTRLAPADRPHRLVDLLHPVLHGQVALARPTAGTTGGHVAALTVAWGQQRADAFFTALHANGAVLVGGNAVAAETVARGDMLAGLCDNDDAASVQSDVGPVNVDLPDQGVNEIGTLAMPCTVALVAGAPHPDAARRLIDFLLSAEVDKALIDARFAWCSARDLNGHGKFMPVDYLAVAAAMPGAIRNATAILEGR
jgi:iron(III) transport system substrate-binding protein